MWAERLVFQVPGPEKFARGGAGGECGEIGYSLAGSTAKPTLTVRTIAPADNTNHSRRRFS